MAEDFADPRDVAWHPRRRFSLYGHAAAEARLQQALRGGKLHHAWLLAGRRGIGKATLAYRFARDLLGSANSPEDPAARLIAAGSHPGLFVLERPLDTKNKRIRAEIAVDDARRVSGFMALTAGAGGWRIVLVDGADDLSHESANALLKIIEEPPHRALFLLVCHRPGSLLPTVRSRCLMLPMAPLGKEDTLRVLNEVAAGRGGLEQAAELSRGSPGRALDLLDSKGAAAFARLIAAPRLTPQTCFEVAETFAGRDTGEEFAIFFELLAEWIAAKGRDFGLSGGGLAFARLHEEIGGSFGLASDLNLDRRQTVMDALSRLDEALKAA